MMISIALAFVFGAFCLQQLPVLPSPYWAILLFGILIIYFILRRFSFSGGAVLKSALKLLFAGLLGFFWAAVLAGIRVSDALPHHLQNKAITLVGVVASSVEHLERGERFDFDVEQVQTENAVVPRHISLSYYPLVPSTFGVSPPPPKFTKFKVGERWRIVAKLKRPHGTQNPHGYDFEAWALAENIRATGTIKAKARHEKLQSFVWHPKYMVESLRDKVKQRISNVLQQDAYSGILQALVMGDDAGITADDWQLLLRTGTTHLMSISGLHITMLSGLAFAVTAILWRRHPKWVMWLPTRKAATFVGVMVAFAYVLLAGFAVPAQRTLYMLLVFGLALWSGRQVPIAQVLALALLTVVILDPWAVVSAGFWLSFSAVALLAYAFSGRIAESGWFKAAVYSQWAVTLGMLPLLLFMFHQASIISPIANAFAIPLISFVVTPLALMGSFLPVDALLQLAHAALEVCMRILDWLNQAPNAVWQQHAPPVWTLLPAVFGMLWVLLPSGFPLRCLGFIGLLPMLMLLPAGVAKGEMKVAILDVGQGLSVVVQTAQHAMLYDAGPKSSSQTDAAKRVILPFLYGEGINKLDLLMLSHDDVDHTGGSETLLTHFSVSAISSSFEFEPSRFNTKSARGRCEAGQNWVWDDVRFEVLHPANLPPETADNNRSCVLRVSTKTGSVLLAGDIEKQAEQQILENTRADSALISKKPASIKADVLAAPHHGSKTSSSVEFVAAVAPKLTIFTNGYLNRFRHPHPSVVYRYQAIGSQILRSDYDGAVLLKFTSGENNKLSALRSYQLTRWRHHYRRYWHDVYSSSEGI